MQSRSAQIRYLRYKADAARAITGPYRQNHREDNNERQSITNVSVALTAGNECGKAIRRRSKQTFFSSFTGGDGLIQNQTLAKDENN
jgi:hypothetical protein